MGWNQQFIERAGNSGGKEGMDAPGSFWDQDLIHSLHQWLDLLREAASAGQGWPTPLGQILEILRKLLGAEVGVVTAYGPQETFSQIRTGRRASEMQLSANDHFNRLCQHLFSATQPLLVADALEGKEFADPFLKLTFPNLSLLTSAWSLSGVVVLFAFFSHETGHFTADHELLLDYFGSPILVGSYLNAEENGLCLEQRG